MNFGEEDLLEPVSVSKSADKAHPTVLRIDGEREQIRIEFTRGEGTGDNYVAHWPDNVTLRDEVDEDGEPIPGEQYWTDFIQGTEIAEYLRAQPSALSNGQIIRKLAKHLLEQKGII